MNDYKSDSHSSILPVQTNNNQARLRLIVNNDSPSGYKSGRSSWREIPDTSSMAKTRSAGTRPKASQPEIVPCDLSPKRRANADCPPTASQAARSASLHMTPINAQTVSSVNAYSANAIRHGSRMGKQAGSPPSKFWERLTEAWAAQALPTSQMGVAKKIGEVLKGKAMSQGSTGRWFHGDGYPETEALMVVAELGKVTIDWLLLERLPKTPATKGSRLERLLTLWEELDDTAKDHVLDDAEGQYARRQQKRMAAALEPQKKVSIASG